jgi:hypothetical protein
MTIAQTLEYCSTNTEIYAEFMRLIERDELDLASSGTLLPETEVQEEYDRFQKENADEYPPLDTVTFMGRIVKGRRYAIDDQPEIMGVVHENGDNWKFIPTKMTPSLQSAFEAWPLWEEFCERDDLPPTIPWWASQPD